MKTCENCKMPFKSYYIDEFETRRSLGARKVCLVCKPIVPHKATVEQRMANGLVECRSCHIVKSLAEYYLREDGTQRRKTCKQCYNNKRSAVKKLNEGQVIVTKFQMNELIEKNNRLEAELAKVRKYICDRLLQIMDRNPSAFLAENVVHEEPAPVQRRPIF
jgi:hypothetical protein